MPTPAQYEPAAVRSLFNEMAATYGVVNLISSLGFAQRWRHQAVKGLTMAEDCHVVDLMSGMNELCRSLAIYTHPSIRLTAVDISPEMIRRARKDWPFPVDVLLANVLTWDCPPGSADVVICSFGLKTFSPDQQRELAQRVARRASSRLSKFPSRPAGCLGCFTSLPPAGHPLHWPVVSWQS